MTGYIFMFILQFIIVVSIATALSCTISYIILDYLKNKKGDL